MFAAYTLNVTPPICRRALFFFLAAVAAQWLSGPRRAASAEPAQNKSGSERQRALAAYLESLKSKQGRDQDLTALLEALRKNPGDAETMRKIHQLVGQAHGQYEAAISPMEKPMSGRDRERMVQTTYRALLSAQVGDISADSFAAAMEDYDRGRFVAAWDRLLLVSRLSAGPDWMQTEAKRYLDETIPAEMSLKIASQEGDLRTLYRKGWERMLAHDWNGAQKAWTKYRYSASQKRQTPEIMAAVSELEELKDVLSYRADLSETPAPGVVKERLAQGLEKAETNPLEAVRLLEPLVYQSNRLAPEASEQARAGLMWAHSQIQTQEALERMRASYARHDISKTMEIIAAILVREPNHPEALKFLGMMEERQKQEQEGAQKIAAPPAEHPQSAAENTPVAKRKRQPKTSFSQGSQANVMKKATDARAQASAAPKPRSLADQVQAMAHYNRGIVAYSNGSLEEAAREWEQAVKLDPDQDKAQRALERVRKEITGIQQAPAP